MYECKVYGPWAIDVDVEATRKAYAKIKQGGAVECGCDGCRNYVAVREESLPVEMHRLCAELGIDPHKEVEVCQLTPDLFEGMSPYNGWMHFFGRIIDRPPGNVSVVPGEADFEFYFRDERHLPYEPFREGSVVQLEYYLSLPWVLPDPPKWD